MRNKDVYIITCSKCDKENRYEDYSCVGPDQRESIIDDSIMTYTCPHCGEITFLKHPLTYIDPVHHFIVQYGQDKEQFFHGVEQLRTTPLYKDYIFRYTDSWLSFKEKIMILENGRDDRLMELYKLALKNELDEKVPSLFLFNKEEEKELLKSKIKLQQDRRKKYETLDTELKNSNDTQISLTDKDSRALMLTNNVSGVEYAVQAAFDSKHKLLVHSHIGASTDKRELSTAALTVQELLQLDSFNTLSDAGYTSGDQLQACKYSGICTYSSPMPSTSPNSNSIPLAEFHYINDGDYYICPCGEQMTTTGKWRIRPNYRSKVYKTSACVNCSIREKCTQNQNGRVIERSEYQDVIDENNARVMNHLLQGRAADIRNVAQLPPLHRPDGNCHSPPKTVQTKRLKQLIVSWCCLFNG